MNKLHSHTQSDRGICTSSYPRQLEHDWTFITLMLHTHTTYTLSYCTVKDCDIHIFTVQSRLFYWQCAAHKGILQLTKDVHSCFFFFKSGGEFCRKKHVNEKFWGIHSSDIRLRSSGLCLVDKDLRFQGTCRLHLYTGDGSSTCSYLPPRLHTLSEPRGAHSLRKVIFSYVILYYVKLEQCFWTLWVQFLLVHLCFTDLITSGPIFISLYFKIYLSQCGPA